MRRVISISAAFVLLAVMVGSLAASGVAAQADASPNAPFMSSVPQLSLAQGRMLTAECDAKPFSQRFKEAQAASSRIAYPSYDAQRRAFYKAMTLCPDEAIGEGPYLARGPKLSGLAADTVYEFDSGPTVEIAQDGQARTVSPSESTKSGATTQSATCSASAPSPGVTWFSGMFHMSPRGYIKCSVSLPLSGEQDAQKMFNNNTTQNIWNWYFNMTDSATGTVLDHWGGAHDCVTGGTTSIRSLGVNMKRKLNGSWSAGTNLTSFWRGETGCHY